MYSIVFKRKRRNPRTGKVRTDREYTGRYRLDPDSPYITIPLRVTEKSVAQTKLKKIFENAQRQANGIIPKNVEDVDVGLFEKNLEDYINDMHGRSLSEGHIYTVEKRMRLLAKACGWKWLGDMTSLSFIQWRQKSNRAASTKNQFLEYLNAFCSWCKAHNPLFKNNPFKDVERLSEKGKEVRARRCFTNDEIHRLLSVAGRYRNAYLVAYYTGLRRKELNALEWRHVNLSSKAPSLTLEGNKTKNGEVAHIALHPDMVAILKELKPEGAAPDERVFSGETMPSYHMVNKHLRAAGIPLRDENNRVASFHSLRHTLATSLAENNVSPHLAQKIMRHSDISLTLGVYTHSDEDAIRRAVVGLPSFSLLATGGEDDERKEGDVTQEKGTLIGTQLPDLSSHDLSLVDQTELIEAGSQVLEDKPLSPDLTQVDHSGRDTGMAALLGLEPRQTDPESVVLPLHHKAIGGFFLVFSG